MQRFWSWLAVELGKRAGLVAVIGLLLTLIAGYGTTKLQFATGQDSYLNPSDQVAKDNVAYQDLFGGEAMLVLLTADEGKTIVDLSNPHNLAEMQRITAELRSHTDLIEAVVSPQSALEWSDNLIQKTPDGQVTTDPTASVAGAALLTALNAPQPDGQPQSEESKAARFADSTKTLGAPRRHRRRPTARSRTATGSTFLTYDNQGEHPQAAERGLHRQHPRPDRGPAGRQRVDREGGRRRGPRAGHDQERELRERHGHRHRCGHPAQADQRLPQGRHAHPRRHRRRGDDDHPAAAVRRALAAAAPRA